MPPNQGQTGPLSLSASSSEAGPPALYGGIQLPFLHHFFQLCERRIPSVQILERSGHSKVGESAGFTIGSRPECCVIIRVCLCWVQLKLQPTLSQTSRNLLLWSGLSDAQGFQCIVQVSCICEGEACIQHPPACIRMCGIYRRRRHPSHTGSNRIIIVMPVNQCNASVGIHQSGVSWVALDEIFEQVYRSFWVGLRHMNQHRSPPKRFTAAKLRGPGICLAQVRAHGIFNVTTSSLGRCSVEGCWRHRRHPEGDPSAHYDHRRSNPLEQVSPLTLW